MRRDAASISAVLSIFTAALTATLTAGCGVFPASVEGHRVRISELRDHPQLKIPAGEVVIWENDLRSDQSITSVTGLWDSGRLQPGDSFSHEISKPGTYTFLSVFDPEIRGTLNVDAK